MARERVIVIIGCMDRRENEIIDERKEHYTDELGLKVIDLRAGGAHVAPLEKDLDDIFEKYDVESIYLMPHGSKNEVKGCGAVATGKKVASGELKSERIMKEYVEPLAKLGVDFSLPLPELEDAVANAEYQMLRDYLSRRRSAAMPFFEPLTFGPDRSPRGKHFAVFRFPTDRSIKEDTDSLDLERDHTYIVSSSRVESVLVSVEMAVVVLRIRDIVLAASNEAEFGAMTEARKALMKEPFMEGLNPKVERITPNHNPEATNKRSRSTG